VDRLSRKARSALMARVKGKDTKPELVVRSALHRAGYRFRIHLRRIPGSPDLAFPARKKVIFIHGCFWHKHSKCKLATTPKTHTDYWLKKLEENKKRDSRKTRALRREGWGVLIVWQCKLDSIDRELRRIKQFLEA
jgi:DNA mismatch endonuclease (patch repair protein)